MITLLAVISAHAWKVCLTLGYLAVIFVDKL